MGHGKDLLTRRATYLKKDIYIYPLVLSAEQKQKFLRTLLKRSLDVSTHAALLQHARIQLHERTRQGRRLAWHPSWILTGYSPQRLFELKIIPGRILRRRTATGPDRR